MSGRKTKLTKEIQDTICQLLKQGNYASVACAYAGIGESTYYRWLEQGEQAPRGKYREFWEAVRHAEAEAEIMAVENIRQAMPQDAKLCLEFLSRRWGDRWGKQRKIEHAGHTQIKISYADIAQKAIDDLQGMSALNGE